MAYEATRGLSATTELLILNDGPQVSAVYTVQSK